MKHLVMSIALLALPAVTLAQQPDGAAPSAVAADSAFARARQLVLNGNGSAGRAVADSLLASAQAGTPAYAQALYWRATLAASAADAERDYRRLIVEYPFSPRASDALYGLAQLEMSRGDRAAATEHLDRLLSEHPEFRDHARAGMRLGQLLFDQGQVGRGCAVLQRTRVGVPAADVELRNQIDYYAARCVGVDTAATAVAAQPAPAQPAADTARPAAPTRPTTKATSATTKVETAYTVQVAAFATRAEAQRTVKRLASHGVHARVVGDAKPYRVRVGRYPTRTEAAAAARKLKARHITGFVTEAEASTR